MSKKRRIIMWALSPLWIGPAIAIVCSCYAFAAFIDGTEWLLDEWADWRGDY